MLRPTLKTFSDAGCLAHLIGCSATGKALLVDPKLQKRESYLQTARRFDLSIVAILDTHTHADHLSESLAFLDAGTELWMSAKTRCKRAHRALHDGDEVRVGELAFRVLEVPGHTPDSIALAGHGIVVTGDTLLAGSLARADFRGSDPRRLFESVRAKLLALPDETVVLPGHGDRDVLFTTIGHERRHNADLSHADGGAFARLLRTKEGEGNTPDVELTLQLNLAARPQLPSTPSSAIACCAPGTPIAAGPRPAEKRCEEVAPLQPLIAHDCCWIDVRDPWEFREAHIPGALSYPLSELGFHLEELRRAGPAILQCRSGVRSMTAAKTLQYLGVIEQPINLIGGILRWQELGLPTTPGAGDRSVSSRS
jgi:glyoxylase-like metal-dependent hydrolase (beta-lactamase superfamily II)/rhodanese-related sulfurtransferase